MSIKVRKHNKQAQNPNWWRRYFWSRHEFWAKHTVHRAYLKASINEQLGSYFFWNQVRLRAAKYCESVYGYVPELLLQRPIRHKWPVASSEIGKWLKISSPYK